MSLNKERDIKALNRRIAIVMEMERRGRVRVRELAEKYGVSVRLIQLDLKALRESVQLPIEPAEEKGEWRFAEGFHLKPVHLTPDEKVVLSLALDKLEESEHLRRVADRLASKLLGGFDEKGSPLRIKTSGLEDYDMPGLLHHRIEYAIKERIVVEMTLQSGEKVAVAPYKILNFDDLDDLWYLFGKSRENEKLDLWLLDAVIDVRYAGEEFFVSERWLEETIDTRLHSPAYEDGEAFEVVARVAPTIAHLFEKKKFLSSQRNLEKEEDGSLEVSFVVSHVEDVDNLIKAWLPDITVVSPAWYRKKLAEEMRQMAKRLNF